MSIDRRKLEFVLKEINMELSMEGILSLRLTQDIWTKLMSNLLQEEYEMAFPIRKDLQTHMRKRRPEKIHTFNQIIYRLDEILDTYIPPPDLNAQDDEKNVHALGSAAKTSRAPDRVAFTVAENDRPISEISNESESGQNSARQNSEEDDQLGELVTPMKSKQGVLKATIDHQQMTIKKLEETVNDLERKNADLKEIIKTFNEVNDDQASGLNRTDREIQFLRNELKIKDRTLQLSLIERNELLDRLASVTSYKFADGYTGITDLSDINKPTALADKYAKLYETEWNDCYVSLTLQMKEERLIAQWLLEILQDAYWYCVSTNEAHTKMLLENLVYPFRTSEAKMEPQTFDDVTKMLVIDLKKATAHMSVIQLQVHFVRTMQKSTKPMYDEKIVKNLSPYIDKCVELCWYMVNQSPTIIIDTALGNPGDEFDRDTYRFYGNPGSKLDYVVWPALFISNREGYMLYQGVAQAKQEAVALRIATHRSKRS